MIKHSMARPTRRRFLQSTLVSPLALGALGRPAGAQGVPPAQQEILINTTTSGFQHRPVVVGVARAEAFVALWIDRSDSTIKGRSFSAAGDRSGPEFTVNSSTEGNTVRENLAVSAVPNGFVVAWVERPLNPPGPRPQVHLRRFEGEGRPVGPQIPVSNADVDTRFRPAVTSMIDGGFVVVWVGARADQRIRGQRFSIDGTRNGQEFAVNANDGFHESPLITRLVNGNYVVAWRSDPSAPGGGAISLRIFNLQGAQVVGETVPRISGFRGEKALTALADGRFAIAHIKHGTTSDIGVPRTIVEANVFAANGAAANISFTVPTERGINASWPSVAPLDGGRLLVAWAQKSAETFSTTTSIRARAMSPNTATGDAEFVLNTHTAGDRSNVAAASIFGGGFRQAAFVAWDDSSRAGGDPSELAVRGRLLNL